VISEKSPTLGEITGKEILCGPDRIVDVLDRVRSRKE
jgi:hypothetical protein